MSFSNLPLEILHLIVDQLFSDILRLPSSRLRGDDTDAFLGLRNVCRAFSIAISNVIYLRFTRTPPSNDKRPLWPFDITALIIVECVHNASNNGPVISAIRAITDDILGILRLDESSTDVDTLRRKYWHVLAVLYRWNLRDRHSYQLHKEIFYRYKIENHSQQRLSTELRRHSALAAAAYDGDVKLLQHLLNTGVDLNFANELFGCPVEAAARRGHTAAGELLLQKGAPCPRKKVHGQTALYWACKAGSAGIVRELLGRSSPAEANKGVWTWSPLGAAVREGHIHVARLLIVAELPNPEKFKQNIISRSLIDNARRGNMKVLGDLLDDDSFPWLPLHAREALMAAVQENVELAVKQLISWKPDLLNSRGSRLDSSWGVPQTTTRTVISLAAENGQADMVRLLLGYDDIKPDYPDRFKRTALAYAAAAGKDAVVKLLIARRDVNPNAKDIKLQTPLMLATINGHEDVVRTMLQCEAVRMDMRDIDGRTALWHATESGNGQIVSLLRDTKRETELDFSISFVFPKKKASRQSGMFSSVGDEAM